MLASLSSQVSPPPAFQHLLPIELPSIVLPPPSLAHTSSPPLCSASPSDFGFGIISALCSPELVDRVLAESEREEQRCRLLPARLTVYGTLYMCLNPDLSYQKLMYHLGELAPSPQSWRVPNRSSFARARPRLGWEVMERLYRVQARPMAQPAAASCFWRGRRVMAIDGTTWELANTPQLRAAFGGQSGANGGQAGLPQLRAVSLTEVGTRAMVDVEMDRYDVGESEIAGRLLRSVQLDMLILCDRYFSSIKLWRQLQKAGADLVWRIKSNVATRVIEFLPDGSYLASFRGRAKRKATVVRVIEYTVEGSEEIYRLMTNLLDPLTAPARELTRLYAERWEIETSYDELKTYQAKHLPLRSLTDDGVRQEFWAHCLLYNIARQLVYRAGMQVPEQDPDRVSFSDAICAIARSVTRRIGLKASRLHEAVQRAIAELTLSRNLLTRRDRSCPRVVRYSTPKYRSRARHPGPVSIPKSRRPQISLRTPQIT